MPGKGKQALGIPLRVRGVLLFTILLFCVCLCVCVSVCMCVCLCVYVCDWFYITAQVCYNRKPPYHWKTRAEREFMRNISTRTTQRLRAASA